MQRIDGHRQISDNVHEDIYVNKDQSVLRLWCFIA